jgi:hypothetical protein
MNRVAIKTNNIWLGAHYLPTTLFDASRTSNVFVVVPIRNVEPDALPPFCATVSPSHRLLVVGAL